MKLCSSIKRINSLLIQSLKWRHDSSIFSHHRKSPKHKQRRFAILRLMTHHENVKIVAFVGLAGSGKSSAVEYLTKKGIPKIYFGGVIYKAMEEAGIEITWDSQKKFREEIREREGKDFVVKRVIKEAHDLIAAGQHRIVLDGLYSWSEYKILKHEFPGSMTVIAIVTPKHER